MAMPDPRPILAEFLPPESIRSIEPLGNAGGWSGSLLWRVEAASRGSAGPASRDYCLRRWPEGTHRERVAFIHTVLTHVAAQGIDFVSTPIPRRGAIESALLKYDNYLWDLTSWLPGTADFQAHPSRPRLATAMHALARFHTAASSIPTIPSAIGVPPSFAERLDQVQQLLVGDLDCIAAATQVGFDAGLDLRAGQLLSLVRRQLPHLLRPLESASREALRLSPAIRDIHRDHVLFTGDRVTGLVDFGALRIDTPLADVARLVGSLAADDSSSWRIALDAYAELRPLDGSDRGRVYFLDHSGQLLGGLNWLRWLYVERRDMGPLDPIIKRLDEIIARLIA